MFTGIITLIGTIDGIKHILDDSNSGLLITIKATQDYVSDIIIGDSISVQGACMTVVDKDYDKFYINVSKESLNCTYGLDIIGNQVNLEKSMKLGEKIGGHILYGHIDCIGKVKDIFSINESLNLIINIPISYLSYFIYKGSVAIDGVSLTVNKIDIEQNYNSFNINLNIIPHTLKNTTLKFLKKLSLVNIEIDIVARYIIQFINNNH
ncbi:Riboflavin synthase [Candidatus Kinetoplastibacterium sorsogonicusi]|uniref:Riboflavin synthase n=1 Tax=Candidatus Kinetoplastidibacterium kentomonadis TaxID=1576550 RepID=A0A3Q8ERP2_9PROT|nr:riboflavin synthase [Candidatus Kinetoplastibacterium sorsogonicusi]AWD32682.1 Riboflavin synthase [Candidatus Kinetoplastibacterium sorsogonicusi]